MREGKGVGSGITVRQARGTPWIDLCARRVTTGASICQPRRGSGAHQDRQAGDGHETHAVSGAWSVVPAEGIDVARAVAGRRHGRVLG